MRTFSAQQLALAKSASIKPILLLVLTTYTDRALGTVGQVYYFSDRPVLYDYANTGTVRQFDAVLLKVSDLMQSIPYLPGTTPAGLESELRITLSNLSFRGGLPLVRELRANNLEFSTIELSSVYGPPDQDSGWYDLRAYVGDEHVVELRAEIEMAEGIDDQIFQLRCKTTETQVPWVRADDATITDPKDLGARLPVIYGAAKRVPCIGWEVGWLTTLVSPIADGTNVGFEISVTDKTGFPTASFRIRIDGESMTIASRSLVTSPLIVAARGVAGTPILPHDFGAVVAEVPQSITYVVAGHAVSSIDKFYFKSPFSDELVEVEEGTRSLSSSLVVPSTSVASVTFAQDVLESVMTKAYTSSRVTMQPNFTSASAPVLQPKFIAPSAYNTGTGSPADEYFNFTGTADNIRMGFSGTWKGTLRCFYNNAQGLTTQAVTRYRVWFRGTGYLLNSSAQYGQITATLYFRTLPGATASSVSLYFPTGSTGNGVARETASDWFSAAGLTEQSFHDKYFEVQINSHDTHMGAADYVRFTNWGVEVEEYVAAPLARITDAEIAGPSVGFGLRAYADVSGPAVPTTFAPGYSFDTATGYSVSGCTVSADATNKAEGASSLKMTVVETTLLDCETLPAGWGATWGYVTLDSTTYSRGANSWKLAGINSGTWAYLGTTSDVWAAGKDFRNMLLAVDVRVHPSMYGLTATYGIAVWISSSYNFAADYRYFIRGTNNGMAADGVWRTLVIDPTSLSDGGYTDAPSAPDLQYIRGFRFSIWDSTVGTQVAWIDNVRLIPKTAVAQLNGPSGTVNLTALTDTHRIALRGTTSPEFSDVEVAWSNSTSSGTALPAAYRYFHAPGSAIGGGAFLTSEQSTDDAGSPGVDNVKTIRVAATSSTVGRGILAQPATLWIDKLEVSSAAAGYYGSIGGIIEHPADIVRHLLTQYCGLNTAYIHESSFASWAANLPSGFRLGIDLRALGETIPEVLSRLGYEGRASLLRSDSSSSSLYKALCAESDYTWPASSGKSLTAYSSLSEVGRDGREIATRFQYVYSRDPSIGSDLAAFSGLVRANPTVSDVSVSAATLATRETKYGRRDAAMGVLLSHYDDASARDVAGYYVAESGRDAGTFLLAGVAWWQAADVEIGDILDLYPPWRSGTVKVQVIEVLRKFGSGVVDIRAVEVL